MLCFVFCRPCFHLTQPLLAAALQNDGSAQLWNYRMGVLVDRFEEHEGLSVWSPAHTNAGPIRGVVIHPSRALLVTGSDDYKIRVQGQPPKSSGMVSSADICLVESTYTK
ncbi:hypothetical protein M378DRAFT_13249 [Amanita muscaria Koide BX008]|uniref:Uncharacterized protein n=1 Tax=Amanita muscaria (strain Koide BX008) TaxID=946122 RepID=A0A0C2WZT4_AMAMK|nr:hypothetical protein M378DRAFT_13249 [Amanita muscaria Koide BX008]